MKKIILLNVFLVLSFTDLLFSQPSFSPKTDFASSNSPYYITSGDLNGDGLPDLVTANNGQNTISVLFNTATPGASTPSFSSKTDFMTGAGPYSVAIADINGDGKLDLAVSNFSSNTISIFINTAATGASTPSFSAKTDFATGPNPQIVSVADFNGDGKQDLAVDNAGTNTVSVLLNTTATGAATPAFSAKTDFTTGMPAFSVTIADINKDGKPDLAAGCFVSNVISILLNTTAAGASTPAFSAKTDFNVGTNPGIVAAGDINNDGKTDLAAVNINAGSVSIILNTTASGAATPAFLPTFDLSTGASPQSVIFGDINNDGKPDWITTNTAANNISVFLNTTSAGATTPTFLTRADINTGGSPRMAVLKDFNGDGKPDLAVANSLTNNISVFLNTMSLGAATASFSAKTDFTVGALPNGITFGDINMDGKQDIAVTNAGPNNVSVFLNTAAPGASAPSFSAKTDFTTSSTPASVAFCDFNGDGKPDMAVVNLNSSSVSILLNTTTPGASTPSFSTRRDFSVLSSPTYLSIGDLNGDGKYDIVTHSPYDFSLLVLLNTTAPGAAIPSFTDVNSFYLDYSAECITISDFNGDGKNDLAVASISGSLIGILVNTTSPGSATLTFEFAPVLFSAVSPSYVSSGDINNDGKPDLAWANGNSVSVVLNTTTPGSLTTSFSAATNLVCENSSKGISIGDFNGDGKPDIFACNYDGNSCSFFLNKTTPGASSPLFNSMVNYVTGANPTVGCIADLNNDGKRDMAVANYTANTFSVFLNSADIPLPVELASFTSSVTGNNVTLNWSTSHEENNSGFEIERNSFGEGWKKAGEVKGNGTTNITQNYTFSDKGLTSGYYRYRLKQIDYNGNYKFYGLSEEVFIGVPNKFSLYQNYPNPFNPETRISYQLPANGFVSLKVYDLAGKEITGLVNEVKDAGYHSVTFNAKNLASGTYLYKLSTDKFSDVKKMVVVK